LGIIGAIGNFIFNNDYDESYEQGSNWAERVIEAGDELSWNEASELADECGKDPDAFYDGYRDNWNAFADVWNSQHGYKEPSWWDKLCGRG